MRDNLGFPAFGWHEGYALRHVRSNSGSGMPSRRRDCMVLAVSHRI